MNTISLLQQKQTNKQIFNKWQTNSTRIIINWTREYRQNEKLLKVTKDSKCNTATVTKVESPCLMYTSINEQEIPMEADTRKW